MVAGNERWSPSPDWRSEGFCYAFAQIALESSTMSCCPTVELYYLCTLDLYYQQLNRPESANFRQQNRSCVPSRQRQATHIDRDSPEVPDIGWKVLMPYSPDLVPSYWYLFLSMANNFDAE